MIEGIKGYGLSLIDETILVYNGSGQSLRWNTSLRIIDVKDLDYTRNLDVKR